jgi:hypothetical protein
MVWAVPAVHLPQFKNGHSEKIMWDRYEYRERRVRRAEIMAVWAIAATLLLAAAVWSSL